MAEKTLPEEYKKHLPKLSGVARDFFEKSFSDHSNTGYGQSKGSVLAALNSFLSNANNERMFTQVENHIDLNDIMEEGQILLVDTSIKKLGDNGAQFLAKLMVGLVNIASQQRDIHKKLRPVYVYVDEAWMALSAAAERMFFLAREQGVGLTICSVRPFSKYATYRQSWRVPCLGHTRFAGSCVGADRNVVLNNVGTVPEALKNRREHGFMLLCQAKKFPENAILIRPGKQYLDSLPRRNDAEMGSCIGGTRGGVRQVSS
ncbi:MAG: hypothetical protein IPI73_30290 [Betaproteobacteria bacterium]|nr:hypothetical protein [Betaproteobacteria bacterium]